MAKKDIADLAYDFGIEAAGGDEVLVDAKIIGRLNEHDKRIAELTSKIETLITMVEAFPKAESIKEEMAGIIKALADIKSSDKINVKIEPTRKRVLFDRDDQGRIATDSIIIVEDYKNGGLN